MQNIILLILCLAIGIALRRFGRVPDNAHMTLNTFVIYVAFPASILSQVHGLHLRPNLLLSVMMPWLMFLTGAALFWTIARYLDLPPTTTGALMLTGGLGNTSFLGLPTAEALYGKSGIATGILIDTPGTCLVRAPLLFGMMSRAARLRPLSQQPRCRSEQRSQTIICLVPDRTLPMPRT
jgi:predicted permease